MRNFKSIIIIILIIIFIILVALFAKIYMDVIYAQKYINFVTNSTNDFIGSVEDVNKELSELQYNQSQDFVGELESKLNELKVEHEGITEEYESYSVPYGGDDVNAQFNGFIEETDNLILSLENLIKSIKDLEQKEEFSLKLDEYINYANVLQEKSSELEQELNEYVESYNKVDFKRILDGIKSI